MKTWRLLKKLGLHLSAKVYLGVIFSTELFNFTESKLIIIKL